jgi:hypothetical protein
MKHFRDFSVASHRQAHLITHDATGLISTVNDMTPTTLFSPCVEEFVNLIATTHLEP